MPFRLGLLALGGLVIVVPAAKLIARPDEPAASRPAVPAVSDLWWLCGQWVGDWNGERIEEHWSEPEGGAMMGMCRMTRGTQRVLYEFLLIEPGESGPVYRVRHFRREMKALEESPHAFAWLRGERGEAVFENPDHDMPRRIIYRQKGDDAREVVLEGEVNGKQAVERFTMKRMAAAHPPKP